jgi:hypothetical protein
MPITYNALRTVNGYRSPGFSVSTAGDIQTDATLTVSGTVTLNQSLTSSANFITSENFVGTNLQLSSIAIEGNSIRTSITNQDLLLSVDGTGTIRLQESVEITGILTAINTLEASTVTTASAVFSGGVGIVKSLRVGSDSYVNDVRIGKGASGISTNTVLGVTALNAVVDGTDNTGVGFNSLNLVSSGDFNTAVGSTASDSITTANNNTSLGYAALTANVSSDQNTAVGANSLSVTLGAKNIGLGYNSGSALATGNANVILGSATGSTITGTDNNILLSDGDGNIRQTFDSAGVATFNAAVTVTGTVSANDATANGNLTTFRQTQNLTLAYMLLGL